MCGIHAVLYAANDTKQKRREETIIMTQRERVREDVIQPTVGIYETDGATTGRRDDTHDDDIIIDGGKDQVRWGPIIAGIFTALATLITLSVLGLAIGLSSFDAGDAASTFGIGAGIWGAISALIAFFLGGYMAARAAAMRGFGSGILQGAMVWLVAIPLLVYLLGSGIGATLRTAGGVVGTAAEVAAPVAGAATDNPALQATAQAQAQGLGQAVQATASALGDQVTPGRVEQAANSAGQAAWGVLLSLGLGAAASILGGHLGARRQPTTVMRAA